MESASGIGPDNPLKVKLSVRNIPAYRDPGTIVIDQLKTIGIEAEMETIIVFGCLFALAAWAYKTGKRTGSRKGFGAGRHGRRKG